MFTLMMKLDYLEEFWGYNQQIKSIIEKISSSSYGIFAASDQVIALMKNPKKVFLTSNKLMGTISDDTHNQQASIEEIYALFKQCFFKYSGNSCKRKIP